MKELSIEEKATRYNEVVNKLKRFMAQGVDPLITRADAQDFFPELRESEDERIKKHLIKFFEDYGSTCQGVEITKIIAWLEKQGEHAKFLSKIQVGDKVTRNEDGVLVNLSQLKRIAKPAEKQGKNNMGTSEATKKKLEDSLNKALEKETPESWNEFLEKQAEQKPTEWSEKDEDTLHCIIDALDSLDIRTNTNGEHEDHTEEIYWLKSLKDRYTWKPSDKQMEALKGLLELINQKSMHGRELISLIEQLKKLKG